MTRNPFEASAEQTPKLSAEEQAEYDRLAKEEADALAAQQGAPGQRVTTHDVDTKAEESYPVENGAVRWDDAANGGDTAHERKFVYDTPWGRRELSATEVTDFGAQGVPITRVDDEPQTSLDAEREELRKIELTNRDANTTSDR